MENEQLLKSLKEKSLVLRRHVIKMIAQAKSGHPGGSLSAADIITTLYFHQMKHDPQKPHWEERDRFVLCKGHAAPILYAALAEAGYFPVDELLNLRKLGSKLQGHPDMKKVPGVDMSTGSLGQGLSAANGMALAAKLDKKDYKIYALLGDGELQEGQVWEAAMTAAHYKLDNVIAFVDYNGLQIDGPISEVKSPNPISEKWRAFGWHVIKIDGHDYEQILEALETAQKAQGKPTVIVARTIKGKGVSFMENQASWHGSAPNAEQVEKALADLI